MDVRNCLLLNQTVSPPRSASTIRAGSGSTESPSGHGLSGHLPAGDAGV